MTYSDAKNKCFKKDGSLTSSMETALMYTRIEGNKIYCKSWDYKGRNLRDTTQQIKTLLRLKNFKSVEVRNGFKCQTYLSVSKKAIKFLKQLPRTLNQY